MAFSPALNDLSDGGKNEVRGPLDSDRRSSCPLPLWSSPCVSRIKTNSVCFFLWFFLSEVKSGHPPTATCGTRNRRLRFARESWWKENRWKIEMLRQPQESRAISYWSAKALIIIWAQLSGAVAWNEHAKCSESFPNFFQISHRCLSMRYFSDCSTEAQC